MRRSRCPVRDGEKIAARVPGSEAAANVESIDQWILCLERAAFVKIGKHDTGRVFTERDPSSDDILWYSGRGEVRQD